MRLIIVTLITLLRLPLAVASTWLFIHNEWLWSYLCFMSCVATDVVDGKLARRWNVVTQFGEQADLFSDIAMFYVYVPGALYCAGRFIVALPPQTRTGILVLMGMGVVGLAAIITRVAISRELRRWYIEKGSFWVGTSSVALVGLWVSLNLGWWAASILVGYGAVAILTNLEKIKKFL